MTCMWTRRQRERQQQGHLQQQHLCSRVQASLQARRQLQQAPPRPPGGMLLLVLQAPLVLPQVRVRVQALLRQERALVPEGSSGPPLPPLPLVRRHLSLYSTWVSGGCPPPPRCLRPYNLRRLQLPGTRRACRMKRTWRAPRQQGQGLEALPAAAGACGRTSIRCTTAWAAVWRRRGAAAGSPPLPGLPPPRGLLPKQVVSRAGAALRWWSCCTAACLMTWRRGRRARRFCSCCSCWRPLTVWAPGWKRHWEGGQQRGHLQPAVPPRQRWAAPASAAASLTRCSAPPATCRERSSSAPSWAPSCLSS
mmetsp:Transcript_11705/g.25110  ORF Transcript_11705/g.25110 Transcript_11705/m.25110 type:complete len:307 (+) Transcript_11705:205-1125(+)